MDADDNPISGDWDDWTKVDNSTDEEYRDIYGGGSSYGSPYGGPLDWRIESGELDANGDIVTDIFYQSDGVNFESVDGLTIGATTDISPTYDWGDEPDTSIEGKDKATFVRTLVSSEITDLSVIGLGDAAGFYNKTSYLRVSRKVPVSGTNRDWSVHAGERTRAVYPTDRTDSTLTGVGSADDLLVLRPGTDTEERASIKAFHSPATTGYTHGFWETATTLSSDEVGVSWAILPKSYPWPGNELIVSEGRHTIVDVKRVQNAGDYTTPSTSTVLQVSPPLPMNMGKGNEFFIVHPGVDPYTTFFEDDDPTDHLGASTTFTTIAGDHKGLEGKEIQIYSDPPVSTTIKSVVHDGRLELATRFPVKGEKSPYRIVTGSLGRTYDLNTSIGPPTTAEFIATLESLNISQTPRLTVWTIPDVMSVTSASESDDVISFMPAIESAKSGLSYVVTDDVGPKDYGRYLLLKHKNDALTVDAHTDALDLHVAEVIHKKGSDKTLILQNAYEGLPQHTASGNIHNDIVSDDSADDLSSHFFIGHAPSSPAGPTTIYDVNGVVKMDMSDAMVGDELTVKIRYQSVIDKDGTPTLITTDKIHRTYITEVRPASRGNPGDDSYDNSRVLDFTISPKLPVTKTFNTNGRTLPSVVGEYRTTLADWAIHRNSISFAIREALRLRAQITALRDMVEHYTVDKSSIVESVLKLLEEKGMDRARDLLIDGELSKFFSLTYEDASYAGSTRSAVQATGKKLILEEGD